MTWNYYNEVDAYAAQWLRNLIAAGHLPDGEVDERSITDVRAEDLKGFSRCHWFAGIGIWPLALRRAGLDDLPVWSGSCPCQPFSAAGKQKGFDDERHLWPGWFDLIAECRPPVILGEQVASALAWFDLVQADLEDAHYAVGASDLCAAGFGGAHIRQRLYFCAVADAHDARPQGRPRVPERAGERLAGPRGVDGWLADNLGDQCGQVGAIAERSGSGSGTQGLGERPGDGSDVGRGLAQPDGGQRFGIADGQGCQRDGSQAGRVEGDGLAAASGGLCGLADAEHKRHDGRRGSGTACRQEGRRVDAARSTEDAEREPTHAPLLGRTPVDWLFCRDGKWRPVAPGAFPLVDAHSSRVGSLRAYGNALDLGTAQGFCEAVAEALGDLADAASVL